MNILADATRASGWCGGNEICFFSLACCATTDTTGLDLLYKIVTKMCSIGLQIETLSQLIKGDNIIIFIIIVLPVDIKIYNVYSSVE